MAGLKIIKASQIELAVQALEAGELVIVPTRRWYMICANAQDSTACDRVFLRKRRPSGKSLACVMRSTSMAEELFVVRSDARRLMQAFWPGDLALILPWRDVNVGKKHAAVGTPDALVIQESGVLGELAQRTSVNIAATTANISGDAGPSDPGPAITVAEVARFVDKSELAVAVCVDGGICPIAHHLTIVDCTGTDAKLVRDGVVHKRAVAAALI